MRSIIVTLSSLFAVVTLYSQAHAACGCDKPAPPPAAIRPFAAYAGQNITLWEHGIKPRKQYKVVFTSRAGTSDWTLENSALQKDFYDRVKKPGVRTQLPGLPLGPCTVSVYDAKTDALVFSLPDDQLTVTSSPVVLRDVKTTLTRDNFQAGVGADGTIYIAIDTSQVTDATTFTGVAQGYPLTFDPSNVAVFNSQGFEMVFLTLNQTTPGLDPAGWFRISPGTTASSAALSYWRHDFHQYTSDHLKVAHLKRSTDGEWHADGTPHVDNNGMVITIAGRLPNGSRPKPGSTAPFTLIVSSTPAPVRPTQ